MHIGITYFGKRGGIAHYTEALVSSLLNKVKITVYASTYSEQNQSIARLPVQVRLFPTYQNLFSFVIRTLCKTPLKNISNTITQDAPDLIIDTGSGPWGHIISQHIPIPWIQVCHDVIPHQEKMRPLVQISRRLFPGRQTAWLTLSDFSADLLRQQVTQPVIASKHGIILPSDQKPDVQRIVNLQRRWLFLGRIEAYKGIDSLVNAFALAKQQDANIHLTIAGSGNIAPPLQQKIAQLGIQLINKWLDTAEIQTLASSHGVVVMPYLEASQSGVAAVALAHGLPMVATNTGALPEQVQHQYNGLIVPPGDAAALASALLTIAHNPKLAEHMSLAAQTLAAGEYNWSVIGNDLLQNIAELQLVRK